MKFESSSRLTLFCIWNLILNSRGRRKRQINRSLVEHGENFGRDACDAVLQDLYFWAPCPKILGRCVLGVIRAVKGVIIGQLLFSIVAVRALFEPLSSNNFMNEHFLGGVDSWLFAVRSHV